MSDREIHSTTQAFLEVYDITNDMVILKDGTVSVILQIGTMNFSLLAEQEQDAVIFTYGSLLNSLNFPIQINIQSQTKDATKYLRLLDEQIQKALSQQKANLIRRYQAFVSELIKERNVLEKKFYVIIPASPGEMGLLTAQSVIPGKTQFDITTIERTVILEKAANILDPRRDHIISQFNRLGLFAQQLNTQEIIRNFYLNYNPEATEGQEIGNSDSYTTPLVRASFSKNLMQSIQENSIPGYKVAESITLPSPDNSPQLSQTNLTAQPEHEFQPNQPNNLPMPPEPPREEIAPKAAIFPTELANLTAENIEEPANTQEVATVFDETKEQTNMSNTQVLSESLAKPNPADFINLNTPTTIPQPTQTIDAPGLQLQQVDKPLLEPASTSQTVAPPTPSFRDLSPRPDLPNASSFSENSGADMSFQEEITPINPITTTNATVPTTDPNVKDLRLETPAQTTMNGVSMKAPAEL